MYAAKQYAYSFHRFFLAMPFSCSSRRSLRYTLPNFDTHRLTLLYTIHFSSNTHSEQRRGEQLLIIGVNQSAAEYIGESVQYRAKNQQATTNGAQKKGWENLIIGGQNLKGFDCKATKIKYA